MSKDNDDKQSQLDLGLTQILESLSESTLTDEPTKVQPENNFGEGGIHPKVQSVVDSISNQNLPVVLVVPQLLELFDVNNLFDSLSKDKAIGCAVDVVKNLLNQDESLLADSVISVIKNNDLSSNQIKELLVALEAFIEIVKDSKPGGFTSEDPKLLNARLSILDFYRSIKPKTNTVGSVEENKAVSDKFEFAPTADRKIKKTTHRKFNPYIFVLLIVAVLIAGYYLFLNYSINTYEIADSEYNNSKYPSSYGSLVNDDTSIQRQDVSNLSALMYDVSRQPTVEPTQLVKPTVAPAPKAKVSIDMTGPIEPERVQQLMDNRDSSIYERPVNRIDRLPILSDDYLPSERERLPSRDRDTPRGTDRPGRFNTGQRYEVMINTSVMDAPSFNAKEVEELYVGDRVRVEARLGRWLKIRSRDGNPGYILAGDAEKLFD